MFKRYLLLVITLNLFFSASLISQNATYRIFLKDKGNENFEKNSTIYQNTLKLHSKKCLERRSKVLSNDSLITIEDAPIYQPYIDEMISEGAQILNKLRWKNYCVISIDSNNIDDIEDLDFVKKVERTSSISKLLKTNEPQIESSKNIMDMISIPNLDYTADFYGESYNQLQILNIPKIHRLGIWGDNVNIGFEDNGFRWRSHKATKIANILSEYDFIHDDSITYNETGDPGGQDGHGQLVFSVVSGYDSLKFVGAAPKANFALAKTEDMRYEKRIEEDNFAAGAEWLESLGMDIISASLSYFNMDTTEVGYLYDVLDGNSTIAAQYCNLAVKKGIIFIVSAGNTGPSVRTIGTPADADSAITVGGLRQDGLIPADMSSRGPNAKGSLKPNIVANGIQVACVDAGSETNYIKANGTSLSSPLICGFTALMLSVFPEIRPWEFRETLYSSATNFTEPNNIVGYGRPDLFKAMTNYNILISPTITYSSNKFQRVQNYIFYKEDIQKVNLYVKFADSQTFEEFNYQEIQDGLYSADVLLDKFSGKPAKCYLNAKSENQQRRYPYNQNEYFEIEPEQLLIPKGVEKEQLPIKIIKETESYLYPSIVNSVNAQISLQIIIKQETDVQITIYNYLGNMLYTQNLGKRNIGISQTILPIVNYPSGIYFIDIKTSYGNEIKKFVVNR